VPRITKHIVQWGERLSIWLLRYTSRFIDLSTAPDLKCIGLLVQGQHKLLNLLESLFNYITINILMILMIKTWVSCLKASQRPLMNRSLDRSRFKIAFDYLAMFRMHCSIYFNQLFFFMAAQSIYLLGFCFVRWKRGWFLM
jgi:hypothetical protein